MLSINSLGSLSSGGNMIREIKAEEDERVPLIPGESMGILKLKMSREDLFKALQKDLTPLKGLCERFDKQGLRVEYDENNQVSLLESDGMWPLFIDDFDVTNSSFSDCIAWIREKDPNAYLEDDMINSDALGIGILTNKPHSEPPFLIAIFPPKNT